MKCTQGNKTLFGRVISRQACLSPNHTGNRIGFAKLFRGGTSEKNHPLSIIGIDLMYIQIESLYNYKRDVTLSGEDGQEDE